MNPHQHYSDSRETEARRVSRFLASHGPLTASQIAKGINHALNTQDVATALLSAACRGLAFAHGRDADRCVWQASPECVAQVRAEEMLAMDCGTGVNHANV